MQETIRAPHWLNILNDATATTSAPSLSSHGVDLELFPTRAGRPSVVKIRHTATGARSCTLKFWGYGPSEYDADGVAIASSAAWMDTEEIFTLASTGSNGAIAQVFEYLTAFERIYVQVTAISGTTATLNVAVGLTDG